MSDKYNMDGHKLLWHLDRVKEWQENWGKGKPIAPLHIDMGITTGCNLGCTYCYGVVQGRKGYLGSVGQRKDMSKETLLRFLREAKEAGVRSIAFIGEGENTLNPALYDALELAKEINLDVSLATHGGLIREERIDLMLNSLEWIRINISAADEESYMLIHRIPQFKRVIENARKLVQRKKEIGSNCTIGFQMIVTKENFDQIVPLCKLGSEVNVDYTVIKPCSDTGEGVLDSPHERYVEEEKIFREAEKYTTDTHQVIIKWSKMMNKGIKNYKTCYGTEFIIAISGDGTVFPCGHWFSIERDKFSVGNINEQSFKDIINSDKYLEVQRGQIKCVNVNKDCETNCRQHYVNQFLWDLKQGKIDLVNIKVEENPPEHINFV